MNLFKKGKRALSITLASAMMIGTFAGTMVMNTDEVKADNPIIQHIFAPDPAPMVYNDTVYLYSTHDEDETVGGFYTMLNWHCSSSTDMVNWTSHGQILSLDDFEWAEDRAWAAQCVEKDGKFYLYVPIHEKNGGVVIGVGVADSPTGPFKDAIGKPLVREGDWNDIDPTVFIDDDGQAYLYFGNPELRYVKLNNDMISYDTSLGVVKQDMTIEAFGDPNDSNKTSSYAEGPWFYKRNNLYYMVYPAFNGSSENISYSTSESPTGPWTFGGVILAPNNCYTIHPGVVDYKGKSFLFYHNNVLDKSSSFHRTVCVEEFTYNEDGSIPSIDQTQQGVEAVENLNPYKRVEAETIAWERGIDIENCANGGCDVYNIHNDNFIKVKNVDFGEMSPLSLTVNAACENAAKEGTIEFRIGCEEDIESTTSDVKGLFDEGFDIHNTKVDTGEVIATVEVKSTGGADIFKDIKAKLTKDITGVHDLFIVFKSDSSDELFKMDYWSFEKDPKADVTPVPVNPTDAPAVPTAVPATAAPALVPATAAPTLVPASPAHTAVRAEVKVGRVKGLGIKRNGRTAVKLSWKKASSAEKYELTLATDKKFKKNVKKITVKKTSCIVKKLKKGKTYYFKVRGTASSDIKTVYGGYSAVKKVKIK